MVPFPLGNLQQTLPAGIFSTLLVAALSDARIQVVLHDTRIEARDDIYRLWVSLCALHV